MPGHQNARTAASADLAQAAVGKNDKGKDSALVRWGGLLGNGRNQLFRDRVDLGGVDLRGFFGEADEEGQVAKAVDPPRHTQRMLMHSFQCRIGEDSPRRSRGLQAMLHVGHRFRLRQSAEQALDGDPLFQGWHPFDSDEQTRLSNEQQRRYRQAIALQVQQEPNCFQSAVRRQQLGFVDDDQRVLAGAGVFTESGFQELEALFGSIEFGARVGVPLTGEIAEELIVGELRINQAQTGREGFAAIAEQVLDERCLADAGRSREERGGLAHFDGIAQLERRPLLAFARVIEAGVGQVVERARVELPVGFVHTTFA